MRERQNNAKLLETDFQRLLAFAGIVTIFVITVTIYRQAFQGFFVQDDFGWLDDSRFRNFREYIQCFFRFNPASSYRPLSQETFFLLGQKAFGMWPAGFHGVSFAAHLIGTTLVYLLLRKFSPVLPSLIGAFFFSIHNAHLSSLYWISAFPEPLALVFFLTTVLLFIRFDREHSFSAYVFSLVSMGFGLMSKESILSLPLVLAAYCAFFSRRRLVWTIPYFVLSASYGVLRVMSTAVKAAPYPLTFGSEVLTNLMTYLAWTAGFTDSVLIVKLGGGTGWGRAVVAAALVAAILVALRLSDNRRGQLFSIVWFLATLQPVLYFSGHIYSYYLAPALVGVSLFLATSLRPVDRRHRLVRTALVVGLIWLSLWTALVTARREGRWWVARSLLARDILGKMPAVDRQVPPERIAYILGFEEQEFGILQNDAAFYAYGFSPSRFILVGLDRETLGQIRALKQSGGIQDYYCFVYSLEQFINTTEEFRRDPEAFLAPKHAPAMKLEVEARELRRGRDSLILHVANFDGSAVDVLYSIDGKPMPPILQWPLDQAGRARVFVSESTATGLYRFRALRDSRDRTPLGWVAVDVQVIVH